MYKNILITGGTSRISFHLKKMIPNKYKIYSPKREELDLSNLDFDKKKIDLIKRCDRIFLCHSVLSNKKHLSKNNDEIHNQLNVNLLSKIKICEISLKHNPKARIFIIGSESGLKGSYDIVYGLSKSSINKYVEERKLYSAEYDVHQDQSPSRTPPVQRDERIPKLQLELSQLRDEVRKTKNEEEKKIGTLWR